MRVLHVVPTYLPATRYGGPIYSVHGLAKAQAELGAQVEVLTTNVDGPHDSAVPLQQAVALDGVSVWYFKVDWGRRWYFCPAMKAWLRKNLQRFDAVHLHSVFLYPTLIAAREAKYAGVAYFLAPRGMLVPELFSAKSSWLKRSYMRLFERANIRDATALHFTSQQEVDDAARLGIRHRNTAVIANGVSVPDQFELKVEKGAHCWLYLGRLNQKKNLRLLIDAFAQLSKEFPDLRLSLAGPDEIEAGVSCSAQLAAQIKSLQVENQVQLLGEVHGDQKWQLLAGSGLKVLISKNENFGNAAAEAMLVGTPVLLSEHVGLVDFIELDSTQPGGWRCRAEMPQLVGMLRAIAQLSPEELSTRGEWARLTAIRRFSWPTIARQSFAMYQRDPP